MDYEGQQKNINAATAAYWVVATMTTLGYGDVVFKTQIGYIFSIIVALSGISILWAVVIPLGITPNLERMVRAAPSSITESMQGRLSSHIIISGYSPIVDTLAERFSLQKMPFLIIERSESVARRIYKDYPVIYGDPSSIDVLKRAAIGSARLFIANENEELNAEVVLTLREISEIEIIAMVDDLTRSRFLRYAGASRIISPKTLLGTFIAQITSPPTKNVFPGAITLFGDLLLVELPIYPGAEIIGLTLSDEVIKKTGAEIAGIWQRGAFHPSPDPEETVRTNSVLMAAGNIEQLSAIRDLTLGPKREGRQIILGYGDVGRRVAGVLSECGESPMILDRRALADLILPHLAGDATAEEDLISAGIKDAIGVLIMLNLDSDAIYATLLAKSLNPDAFVVVRANHLQSAEKIYRAGADYVASLPIVASHMLARIIQGDEESLDLLYEDLELKIMLIGKRSQLSGRGLSELDLTGRFGCRAVALERMGQTITTLDEAMILREGDMIALIGNPRGIDAFSNRYERTMGEKLKLILSTWKNI